MTIDPSTCKPDELYVVKTIDSGDREVYGMRNDPDTSDSWMVFDLDSIWHHDHEVTVLRRADQPLTDWEILRRAAGLLRMVGRSIGGDDCDITADRLEAEHKAAQEKAGADARFAEAERVFKEAWHDADARGESGSRVRSGLRAVIDAGLLAEAVEVQGWTGDRSGWVAWTAPSSRVMLQRIEPGELTPTQARELAAALLTAATHAEAGGRDE